MIRQSPLRWQFSNKVMRIEAIQRSIDTLGARCYLEIGVADGACFCSLTAPEKIGVDPIPPEPAVKVEINKPGVRYIALTSDDFFQKAAPQVLAGGVDVVFIDGLHTFRQAYRDCVNSLKYLNPGGLILLHDCLPTSSSEAQAADTYEEAGRLNGPCWNGLWAGDVWKAILTLRAQHTDLQTCVLQCDHGLGLVYAAPNDCSLSHIPAQIDAISYAELARDTKRLLGLRKPRHLLAVLGKLKRRRT
jgi:Methyltransferase domain